MGSLVVKVLLGLISGGLTMAHVVLCSMCGFLVRGENTLPQQALHWSLQAERNLALCWSLLGLLRVPRRFCEAHLAIWVSKSILSSNDERREPCGPKNRLV